MGGIEEVPLNPGRAARYMYVYTPQLDIARHCSTVANYLVRNESIFLKGVVELPRNRIKIEEGVSGRTIEVVLGRFYAYCNTRSDVIVTR